MKGSEGDGCAEEHALAAVGVAELEAFGVEHEAREIARGAGRRRTGRPGSGGRFPSCGRAAGASARYAGRGARGSCRPRSGPRASRSARVSRSRGSRAEAAGWASRRSAAGRRCRFSPPSRPRRGRGRSSSRGGVRIAGRDGAGPRGEREDHDAGGVHVEPMDQKRLGEGGLNAGQQAIGEMIALAGTDRRPAGLSTSRISWSAWITDKRRVGGTVVEALHGRGLDRRRAEGRLSPRAVGPASPPSPQERRSGRPACCGRRFPGRAARRRSRPPPVAARKASQAQAMATSTSRTRRKMVAPLIPRSPSIAGGGGPTRGRAAEKRPADDGDLSDAMPPMPFVA
jgi:hypothetical protein